MNYTLQMLLETNEAPGVPGCESFVRAVMLLIPIRLASPGVNRECGREQGNLA